MSDDKDLAAKGAHASAERRQFLKQAGAVTAGVAGAGVGSLLLHDPDGEAGKPKRKLLRLPEGGFAVERPQNAADLGVARGSRVAAMLKGAVDAYLDFQQDGGVLLSRLQTEAVLLDSMLSPTRERALDRLVTLLSDEVGAHLPVCPDPLLLRGLLIGVEGVMIHLHRGENFPPERVEEARAVVHTMLLSGLSGAVTMAMQGR